MTDLTRRTKRVFAARDAILRCLEGIDGAEGMVALQYALASVIATLEQDLGASPETALWMMIEGVRDSLTHPDLCLRLRRRMTRQ